MNGNDYITGVEEVKEGDTVIGYTIHFYRQGDVTLYHGTKGADGVTPVIGVVQKDDGRWYWTLNGELLTDDKGNAICASGKDGEDGKDVRTVKTETTDIVEAVAARRRFLS